MFISLGNDIAYFASTAMNFILSTILYVPYSFALYFKQKTSDYLMYVYSVSHFVYILGTSYMWFSERWKRQFFPFLVFVKLSTNTASHKLSWICWQKMNYNSVSWFLSLWIWVNMTDTMLSEKWVNSNIFHDLLLEKTAEDVTVVLGGVIETHKWKLPL